MAKKTSKGFRITRDLVIAAQALRCPRRRGSGVYIHCDDDHPTNCNPRLCTHCTDIFKDMVKVAEEGIDNYI